MAFDYKKEYKEFYLPKQEPSFVPVPTMNYVAVRGKGNPNEDNGLYMEAVQLLYSISYTITIQMIVIDLTFRIFVRNYQVR